MTIHNTFPGYKQSCWQFDLLPVIGVLRVNYTNNKTYQVETDYEDNESKYYSITFQWLFWSLNWQINK